MKIKILSDLHIGKGDGADIFKFDENKFLERLKKWEDTFDYIVFNGDTWDCWHSNDINEQEEEFFRINAYRPTLMSYLLRNEKGKFIFLVGNHDDVVKQKELISMFENFLWEIGGKRIWIEHGHKTDNANYKFAFIGKFVAWLIGWLQRLGWRSADTDLDKGNNSSSDPELYKKYAKVLAKTYKANVVVLGHTHKEMIILLDENPVYINSGSLCNRTAFFPTVEITEVSNKIINEVI